MKSKHMHINDDTASRGYPIMYMGKDTNLPFSLR